MNANVATLKGAVHRLALIATRRLERADVMEAEIAAMTLQLDQLASDEQRQQMAEHIRRMRDELQGLLSAAPDLDNVGVDVAAPPAAAGLVSGAAQPDEEMVDAGRESTPDGEIGHEMAAAIEAVWNGDDGLDHGFIESEPEPVEPTSVPVPAAVTMPAACNTEPPVSSVREPSRPARPLSSVQKSHLRVAALKPKLPQRKRSAGVQINRPSRQPHYEYTPTTARLKHTSEQAATVASLLRSLHDLNPDLTHAQNVAALRKVVADPLVGFGITPKQLDSVLSTMPVGPGGVAPPPAVAGHTQPLTAGNESGYESDCYSLTSDDSKAAAEPMLEEQEPLPKRTTQQHGQARDELGLRGCKPLRANHADAAKKRKTSMCKSVADERAKNDAVRKPTVVDDAKSDAGRKPVTGSFTKPAKWRRGKNLVAWLRATQFYLHAICHPPAQWPEGAMMQLEEEPFLIMTGHLQQYGLDIEKLSWAEFEKHLFAAFDLPDPVAAAQAALNAIQLTDYADLTAFKDAFRCHTVNVPDMTERERIALFVRALPETVRFPLSWDPTTRKQFASWEALQSNVAAHLADPNSVASCTLAALTATTPVRRHQTAGGAAVCAASLKRDASGAELGGGSHGGGDDGRSGGANGDGGAHPGGGKRFRRQSFNKVQQQQQQRYGSVPQQQQGSGSVPPPPQSYGSAPMQQQPSTSDPNDPQGLAATWARRSRYNIKLYEGAPCYRDRDVALWCFMNRVCCKCYGRMDSGHKCAVANPAPGKPSAYEPTRFTAWAAAGY